MKLSDEAQKWHDKIRDEYGIRDETGTLLLQTAFECYDEMRSAQAEMNGNPIYTDRFGQPQENPAAKVARASRTQMISALKALNLELEPDKPNSNIGSPIDY